MPETKTFVVEVTLRFEVCGSDYGSVAKLAENQIKPALEPPRTVAGIPYISSVPRVAGIEIHVPH